MRKSSKKDSRDRKASDIELEGPYKAGQLIFAQNKSNF